MKPTHERSQECLPPKKRDLPVSRPGSAVGGGGGGAGGGDEGAPAHGSSSAPGEGQGAGAGPAEWMRVQPGLQYSVENADGVSVPVDQYGMLYKVALPSVSYSPTSLHPVLSHISPAYSVPPPLLQHPGIPFAPLGYAQIPPSSLQFVSSPYAVPYAVPPGYVPGPLISPQPAVSQPPHVPHLVPYPSVIQEGVVSPPGQPPSPAHAFAKVSAGGGVPLVLSPEQAAAQQLLGSMGGLAAVGGLAAGEGGPRGAPAFYHPGPRPVVAYRDLRGAQEVNGGEEEKAGREQDAGYPHRGVRPPQTSSSAGDGSHDRPHGIGRRYEDRASPGHRSTPDTDLEVQQVVGSLTSPTQGVSGGHKEEASGPLNLSQSSLRSWPALGGACVESVGGLGRPVYEAPPAGPGDPRLAVHPQLGQPPRHAVMLANGQPVLVPLDYKQQQQQQQQQYAGLTNDAVAPAAASPTPAKHSKASDSPAHPPPLERAPVEPAAQQIQAQPGPPALAPAQTQPLPGLAQNPSHFMKGAIIQLATGELKRVEDLQTQDFVKSAEASGGLKIDSSMVVDVRRSQAKPGLVTLHFTVGEQQSKVTIDVPPEHPFFVFGQGWSSCSPEGTAKSYGLACHPLQVGDVCVSITLQQPQRQDKAPPPAQLQPSSRTPSKAGSATSVIAQPMGPPLRQHLRPPAPGRPETGHREGERGEEGDPAQVRGAGHGDPASRTDRTSAEHTRSLSSNYLHTEGSPRTVAHMQGMSPIMGAQRHWSVPSFQRYGTRDEEEARLSAGRPSFIPQEVKLSIEGRSNAGK